MSLSEQDIRPWLNAWIQTWIHGPSTRFFLTPNKTCTAAVTGVTRFNPNTRKEWVAYRGIIFASTVIGHDEAMPGFCTCVSLELPKLVGIGTDQETAHGALAQDLAFVVEEYQRRQRLFDFFHDHGFDPATRFQLEAPLLTFVYYEIRAHT